MSFNGSSSSDSSASSGILGASAWNRERADRPVYPITDKDNGSVNENGEHHHLLKKRIYPTLFTYPTQASTHHDVDQTAEEQIPLHKKSELESSVLLDCLSTNFLFAHLPKEERRDLVRVFEKVQVRKNEVVMRQGEPADYCYMLYLGEVRIEVDGAEIKPPLDDNGDTQGEKYRIFGELALLSSSPHVSTIKATSATCSLFRLGRVHFQRALSPPEHITNSVQERIQMLKLAIPAELVEYLEDDETALKKLVYGMSTRTFQKGDVLYEKNGSPMRFVIVSEGLVLATGISLGGRSYEDMPIGPGESQTSYGWQSICVSSLDVPSAAKIVATTDGKARIITKDAFANAFGDHGGATVLQHLAAKRLARMQLQQISVFKDSALDATQINGLLDLMHHCEYSHSQEEIIMKAGEKVEAAMYFVREGCVTLEMGKGEDKTTETMRQGGYFLEKNMILDQNKDGKKHFESRAIMTAIAQPNTKLDILYLEECRQVVNTTLLGLGKPATVSAIDPSITLTDLKRITLLGAGSFGQVWLASTPGRDQSPETDEKGCIVALKVQAKHQLVQSDQAERVVAERNIMASLHSPFIIRLLNTFQDESRLYMITSLLQGGELESIIPVDGLSESAAKFYAAGILEGLTYMHRKHILHRDVKPSNVLIDQNGYPVLIDLGFAKYVPDKTYTFCGSPMLTAPEIIRHQGYDKGCDHWSWAVLTYRLVTGRYPFYKKGVDELGLYKRIVRGTFELDGLMSIDFRMIIVALLYPEPLQRLGSRSNGWRDIFASPWFANNESFNLRKLRKREMPAPWVPDLKDPLDASRFHQPSSDVQDLMTESFPGITKQQQQTFSSFGVQTSSSP